MSNEIDNYIKNAKPFAKPILNHLRKLIHSTCPDIEESLKWGFPHFLYKGILCSFAAFNEHCAFGFWKGDLMDDPHNVLDKAREKGMGHFGRLQGLNDLPNDTVILQYIQQAIQLNENNAKLQPKSASQKKELVIPEFFLEALKREKKAWENFQKFSYSQKKEYVEWIGDAKQEATKNKRMLEAIQLISEGKEKNWKYQKK